MTTMTAECNCDHCLTCTCEHCELKWQHEADHRDWLAAMRAASRPGIQYALSGSREGSTVLHTLDCYVIAEQHPARFEGKLENPGAPTYLTRKEALAWLADDTGPKGGRKIRDLCRHCHPAGLVSS